MFWQGFKKQADAATKGIRSGLGLISNKAGLSLGARPRSGVAVGSAFKPNKIPSPSLNASASKNMTPSLVRDLKETVPTPAAIVGHGVGKVTI